MPPPPGETEQQVIQWNDTVRRSGVVRVFVGPSMRGSGWSAVVDQAINALNIALADKGFVVTIKRVSKESDAEAVIETTPGSALHGQSLLHTEGTANVQRVTIKIPATPRVSQVDPKAREAGSGVRLYIVAHELIHTLGLTNAAHSRDDVFTRNPMLAQKGVVPRGSNVLTEDKVQTFDLSRYIPPVVLGAATIANLKKAWPESVRIPI
jgi:hypothetical protein